ncbi:MAG: hypothetical protein AAFP70_22490 [Calditrichota bacterium]
MPQPHLIFVYNADSGLFNTLTDIAHKLLSPQTYSCNLCALTHTALGMRDEWKDFLEGLDAELEFLHRDEFIETGGSADVDLPAVFERIDAEFHEWISAETIRELKSLEELKSVIREKI